MKTTRHHKSYDFKSFFNNLSLLESVEYGTIYYTDKDGKYYLIFDETSLSEFTDEEDLIIVREFKTINELKRFLKERGIKNEIPDQLSE
jgi:hypothetical protein